MSLQHMDGTELDARQTIRYANEQRLACWYCGQPDFNQTITFLPQYYRDNTWVVRGLFHNITCLLAYILHDGTNVLASLKLFAQMYNTRLTMPGSITILPPFQFTQPGGIVLDQPIPKVDDTQSVGYIYQVLGSTSNILPQTGNTRYSTSQVAATTWSVARAECDPIPVCWNDRENILHIPYFVPTHYNCATNTWTCQGTFCSLNCVKRYMLDRINSHQYCLLLFRHMCMRAYGGTQVSSIVHAHSRLRLAKYNQPRAGLTITDFRANMIRPSLCPGTKLVSYVYLIYRTINKSDSDLPPHHSITTIRNRIQQHNNSVATV